MKGKRKKVKRKGKWLTVKGKREKGKGYKGKRGGNRVGNNKKREGGGWVEEVWIRVI